VIDAPEPNNRGSASAWVAILRRAALGAVAVLLAIWLWPRPGELRGGGLGGGSTLERIRTAGVVRVGFANEAPYAYVDTATGRLTGESPELARLVFRQLGVAEIRGVLTEFGSLIPALKAGRFDVIAAGMYITPARCREILFSDPTYAIGEAFIVPDGNPLDLHGYRDLRDTEGATLGVVTGAIQLRYARSVGIGDERILIFPDAPSAVDGVAAGRVSAYAGTLLTVNDLLAKTSALLERAVPFTDLEIDGEIIKGYGAFGFRKSDRAFRDAFNQVLSATVGTPRHAELVEPFGFTGDMLPGRVTAVELCEAM
jgi:polar amino acid transport system substrate-binding protein